MITAAQRHRNAARIELEAAAALGDAGCAYALSILQRGARAGRKALDDAAALAAVQRLRADGNPRHAIGTVARAIAAGRPFESVARRLRKKAGNLK